MIQYALTCDDGHTFDSWFQSGSAFDALVASGHLKCEQCGSKSVKKAVMAPRVSKAAMEQPAAPLSKPQSKEELAIAEMRRHVEANADYVGNNFAKEARGMYLGSVPERPIFGEANGAEAKALIEDGIPVAPLPFMPNRKAN